MKNLGYLYEEGKGVAQDFGKALEWYRKGAELGNAAAESGLAGMYRDGKGVPKDLKKAIELYRRAAEHGSKYAQKELESLIGKG